MEPEPRDGAIRSVGDPEPRNQKPRDPEAPSPHFKTINTLLRPSGGTSANGTAEIGGGHEHHQMVSTLRYGRTASRVGCCTASRSQAGASVDYSGTGMMHKSK